MATSPDGIRPRGQIGCVCEPYKRPQPSHVSDDHSRTRNESLLVVQSKRTKPALELEVKDLNPRPELVSVHIQAINIIRRHAPDLHRYVFSSWSLLFLRCLSVIVCMSICAYINPSN